HLIMYLYPSFLLMFLSSTSATALDPLSLHDALPIYQPGRLPGALGGSRPAALQRGGRGCGRRCAGHPPDLAGDGPGPGHHAARRDRKSTRLNSSHVSISYAVFCLKKKNSVLAVSTRA